MAESKVFGFDEATVKRIAEVVRRNERGYRNGDPARSPGSAAPQYPGLRLAKTGGSTIAARSTLTPTIATVTLYDWNEGTGAYVAGDNVDVHNMAGTSIGANRFIIIAFSQGNWIAVSEDCP